MQFDNAIYANVTNGNVYDEIPIARNDCYEHVKKLPSNDCKSKQLVKVNSDKEDVSSNSKENSNSKNSKKAVVVVGLVFATLILLLGAVLASMAYALAEISKLKSELASINQREVQQNTTVFSMLESAQVNASQEMVIYQQDLKKLESAQMNTSHDLVMYKQDLVTNIQQMENFTAEMVASLDAMIARVSHDTAQQIVSSVSALRQQLTQNLSALDTRFVGLDTKLAGLDTSVGDLDTSLADLGTRLAGLDTSVGDLDTSLADLDTSVGDLDTSLADLDTSVGDLDTSLADLDTRLADLGTRLAGSVAGLNTRLADLDTRLISTQEHLNSSVAAISQRSFSISTRCGRTGRWRLIQGWNMRLSTESCLSGLNQHYYSNKRLCVRTSNSAGCSSVQLFAIGAYTSVCGFVKAYQFGNPDAFHQSSSINSPYVEGVSITHGSPRQHIWTFAATKNEHSSLNGCPCMGGNNNRPAFVGNDYFCDTGTSTGSGRVFYGADPLWDGAGCGSINNCCRFNNPPWFYKELPQYTYDDIELRLCSDHIRSEEDIALEAVTIYVK